jgi:hypothetical protein
MKTCLALLIALFGAISVFAAEPEPKDLFTATCSQMKAAEAFVAPTSIAGAYASAFMSGYQLASFGAIAADNADSATPAQQELMLQSVVHSPAENLQTLKEYCADREHANVALGTMVADYFMKQSHVFVASVEGKQ